MANCKWDDLVEKIEVLLYEKDMDDDIDDVVYDWLCDLLDRYMAGERSIGLRMEMEAV